MLHYIETMRKSQEIRRVVPAASFLKMWNTYQSKLCVLLAALKNNSDTQEI